MMSILRNLLGRLQGNDEDNEQGFVKALNRLKFKISHLPERYPYEGQAFGSGKSQAQQQIPILCQNIEDAIKALETGRDPKGNSITQSQVGNGLKRLVQATRKPGFSGLLSTVLSADKGLKALETCLDELEEIASQLGRAAGPGKRRPEIEPIQKPDRKALLDEGNKHKEQGRFQEAIKSFDQIIESDQDPNGWVRYLKGTCLMELGAYEDALDCLEAALKIDPEGDTYRLELGRALYELGRKEEARATFQPLAKHSLVYGLDKKARDWLEKLDLEEGKSEKNSQRADDVARAMAMIPFADPATDTLDTALIHAAESGITEAAEILLKAGANPCFKAPTGWTALLLAARNGHAEIVQALLENGADPDDQNVFAAQTPLILATMGKHLEVIRLLLEAGVDVSRKNQWGRTALSHALPETDSWKMLVEAGAEE